MANRIFYQEDCNLSLLDGKTIAIIGYGSQGHAHALNLKESGCHVIIGLYEGSRSWKKAEDQGFQVFTAAEAAHNQESPPKGQWPPQPWPWPSYSRLLQNDSAIRFPPGIFPVFSL